MQCPKNENQKIHDAIHGSDMRAAITDSFKRINNDVRWLFIIQLIQGISVILIGLSK